MPAGVEIVALRFHFDLAPRRVVIGQTHAVEAADDALEVDGAARAVDRLGRPDHGLGLLRAGLRLVVVELRAGEALGVGVLDDPPQRKGVEVVAAFEVEREGHAAVGARGEGADQLEIGVAAACLASPVVRIQLPEVGLRPSDVLLGCQGSLDARILRLVAREPAAEHPIVGRAGQGDDRIQIGRARDRQLQRQIGDGSSAAAVDGQRGAPVRAGPHVQRHVVDRELAGPDHRGVAGLDGQQVAALAEPLDDDLALGRLHAVVLAQRHVGLGPRPERLHRGQLCGGDLLAVGGGIEAVEPEPQRPGERGEQVQHRAVGRDPLVARAVQNQLVSLGRHVDAVEVPEAPGEFARQNASPAGLFQKGFAVGRHASDFIREIHLKELFHEHLFHDFLFQGLAQPGGQRAAKPLDQPAGGRVLGAAVEVPVQVELQRQERRPPGQRPAPGLVHDQPRQRAVTNGEPDALLRFLRGPVGQGRQLADRLAKAALGQQKPRQAQPGFGTGTARGGKGLLQRTLVEGVLQQRPHGLSFGRGSAGTLAANLPPKPLQPILTLDGRAGKTLQRARAGCVLRRQPQVVSGQLVRRPGGAVLRDDFLQQRLRGRGNTVPLRGPGRR